ncbi:pyridoxamine 5'-phosphate oxidase family protein [Caulobacter sp. BE254]|uniref:pyridoxamine 5'-phosphate oxidase family protein n=1 Tax=Caulobacter sp. BE254 TaxID=2817720 RepID=UPI0028586549|nr:pyridoxamine 5'-phosphate oxidase family protein [Caulobacter sp. BE254]MDR7116624.1 general stress protein 26 [Caulobacter sp. BE254]
MPSIDVDAETLRETALRILSENRIMAVATLRPDGWPQATFVGYMHDGLTLYFIIAREGQKLANIRRDRRISIAIGRHNGGGPDLRGLSLAAEAVEVTDAEEVRRLNAMLVARYPEQEVFTPQGASVAVMKATPLVMSVVDPHGGLGWPVLLRVDPLTGALRPAN